MAFCPGQLQPSQLRINSTWLDRWRRAGKTREKRTQFFQSLNSFRRADTLSMPSGSALRSNACKMAANLRYVTAASLSCSVKALFPAAFEALLAAFKSFACTSFAARSVAVSQRMQGRCNQDPQSRSVTVMITDSCPECEPDHMDIQALTFNKVHSCSCTFQNPWWKYINLSKFPCMSAACTACLSMEEGWKCKLLLWQKIFYWCRLLPWPMAGLTSSIAE